ncbi:CinA family protein [Tropicimonas sp. S265A]|uniref:CinA family protein n=1 Tax=Tropicimonas sp. S265A TaxID=3415134 RepID=UPI003C7B9AF1
MLDLCAARDLRITAAESCTGGKVAAAITEIPGASNSFERGYVTYSNAAKVEILGVSADTIQNYGAVSEKTVYEMANGALARAGADIAVAISGIAGPGGSEFKPEGRVCFALASRGHPTQVETVEYGPIGRSAVRENATAHALRRMIEAAERL